MKYQVLFSLKTIKNIFKTVICCSHDWCLKGYISYRVLVHILCFKHKKDAYLCQYYMY